jgi:hypothetical protein
VDHVVLRSVFVYLDLGVARDSNVDAAARLLATFAAPQVDPCPLTAIIARLHSD